MDGAEDCTTAGPRNFPPLVRDVGVLDKTSMMSKLASLNRVAAVPEDRSVLSRLNALEADIADIRSRLGQELGEIMKRLAVIERQVGL